MFLCSTHSTSVVIIGCHLNWALWMDFVLYFTMFLFVSLALMVRTNIVSNFLVLSWIFKTEVQSLSLIIIIVEKKKTALKFKKRKKKNLKGNFCWLQYIISNTRWRVGSDRFHLILRGRMSVASELYWRQSLRMSVCVLNTITSNQIRGLSPLSADLESVPCGVFTAVSGGGLLSSTSGPC